MGRRTVDEPFNRANADLAAGIASPSFILTLIQEGEASDEDIKWISSSMYGAGAETTSATIAAFLFAMTTHPDIQKKAQKQIDRVVGMDRLPTFEDREDLPYINYILKEILRWQPATPLGAPHHLTGEDHYNGHYMPAGSTILPNAWSMSRDETIYENPERFWPERFVSDNVLDPRDFVFRFGRRICAGLHFADASLFIVIAHILASFDISKARDENGQEIEPKMGFSLGMSRASHPFERST